MTIIAEQRLPRYQQSPFWIMRAVAGNGLGALSFSEKTTPPVRTRSSHALAELAAAAFDAHQFIEDAELKRLYAAGSTPGGVRPKVLVTAHGGEWIAKFPSVARDKGFDVVGLEAASLALAQSAGIDVPEAHLVDIGKRRALLIRRFDITPARLSKKSSAPSIDSVARRKSSVCPRTAWSFLRLTLKNVSEKCACACENSR